MKKKSLLTKLMGALLICSCETPRVVYFEDLDHGKTVQARDPLDISLRVGDKLHIVVSTRDQQITQLFNLSGGNMGGSNGGRLAYIIDSQGNIDFPIIGTLHVAGLRREEVASKIKGDLIASNMVKDPVQNNLYTLFMKSIADLLKILISSKAHIYFFVVPGIIAMGI